MGKKDKPLPILEGGEEFVCRKCGLKHNDPLDPLPEDGKWVYCSVCEVMILHASVRVVFANTGH